MSCRWEEKVRTQIDLETRKRKNQESLKSDEKWKEIYDMQK